MTDAPPVGSSIALVVVNYGSHQLLERNLASTARSGEVDVVVVDSFSSHDERRAITAVCTANGWQLVEPQENVGFGRGMNLGVELALSRGAQWIVLLNPDLELAADDVGSLVAIAQRDPEALVAPRIVAPDGSPFAVTTTDLLLDDGTMRSSAKRPEPSDGRPFRPWLSGACLALGADLWGRANGFDDGYFLYWEDVDFSRRVQESGGRLVVADDITAVHDEGGTQGRAGRTKTETYYYFNIRNRYLYAVRWLEADEQRRWRRNAPTAVRSVILQGGRKQLLTSVAPWRAAWRGVRDGRRLLRGGAPSP